MSEQGVVVIDLGSGSVKAGMKGGSSPTCILTEKQQRALLDGRYPFENGQVTNWEDAEQLLRNIFKELGVKSDENAVLLTQPMDNSKLNKEKMAQLLFEKFNVPAVFLAYANVLSLYATGRLNGVVMESGAAVTTCVAFHQGYAMLDTIVSSDITGNQLTKFISKKLNNPDLDFETVNAIKEQMCSLNTPTKDMSYTLPNGSHINVSQDVQKAPEILLDPSIANINTRSIPQAIVDCIEKVRAQHGNDRAQELYGNIVLSGGNTGFSGLAERVQDEIQSKKPDVNGIVVTKAAQYSTWIGGSILASHESFNGILVTREQYQENGVKVIEGKF